MRTSVAGPLVALVLLTGVAGCGPSLVVDRLAFESSPPERLAILPVVSETGATPAQLSVVRYLLHRDLARLPYLVLKPPVVDRRLRAAGLREPPAFDPDRRQELARALQVDAWLLVSLDAEADLQDQLLFRRHLAGRLQLIDAESGDELLLIEHHESQSPEISLTAKAAYWETIEPARVDISDEAFVALAARFASKALERFPTPARSASVVPPTIDRVELQSEPRPGSGGVIELEARGQPELSATMSLGSGLRVPMVEEGPGRYRGWYRIRPGDRIRGMLTVQVEDVFGVGASFPVSDLPPFDIDARVPDDGEGDR